MAFGKITIHIDPTLHKKVKLEALKQGRSMTEFIVDALNKKMSFGADSVLVEGESPNTNWKKMATSSLAEPVYFNPVPKPSNKK